MHPLRFPLLVGVALLVAGCTDGDMGEAAPGSDAGATPPAGGGAGNASLTLASAAIAPDGALLERHTCDGAGVSPPLNVTDVPTGAARVALTVVDPDVPIPQAPLREFAHWVVWNVSVENGSATFEEGAVPEGAVVGANDANETGWAPPCPPPGSPAHRYVFTAYALDAALNLTEGATRAELMDAMEGHVLANGTLTGTYARRLP